MKIKISSKPEKKTSSKGTVYYSLKVQAEDGFEKVGNLFSDTEPVIDQEIEVDEKYNEQYQNFTWFTKKEKKQGFVAKPSLTVDQQIRAIALQEAAKTVSTPDPLKPSSLAILTVAKEFEKYIKG
jgi:phage terminase small subunit